MYFLLLVQEQIGLKSECSPYHSFPVPVLRVFSMFCLDIHLLIHCRYLARKYLSKVQKCVTEFREQGFKIVGKFKTNDSAETI